MRQLSMSLCAVPCLLLLALVRADGDWSDDSDHIFGTTPAVRILALSDWNNDQHVDLVTVSPDNQFINILLWNTNNGSFVPSISFCPMSNMEFTNAIAADFNRDGITDLAVLTLSGDILITNGLSVTVPAQKVGHVSMWQGFGATAPILSALDIFGNCALPDIAIVDGNGKLLVFENEASSPFQDACNFIGGNFSFKDAVTIVGNGKASPTSLVSFDVSGTCTSDFIFGVDDAEVNMTRTFYLLTSAADPNGDVETKPLFSVPLTTSAPTIMDADGDGSMDFVFLACNDTGGNLSSWSTFRPCPNGYTHLLFILNELGGSTPCQGDECCSGHQFQYQSIPSFRAEFGPWLVLSTLGCGPFAITDLDQYPALVRFGDYNRDGNNDLILASSIGPILLSKPYAGPPTNGLFCSIFESSLPNKESFVPFFFDLDEDGRLDVLASSFNTTTVFRPLAIRNNVDMGDRYFFTATTLNGVKSPFAPYPAWGAIQIGAVHRFQWQDIDTNLKYASGTQQSMTQCQSLQLPRVHFGLGRTYSYIQDYATGFRTLGGSLTKHQWTSFLIPNSQVVAVPYPLDDPSSWEIKLFLSPSKYQTLLLIALGTALTVIGVPIVFLKWKEMQSDKLEIGKMV